MTPVVRVGGYWVRLEQPPAAARYDWTHVLGAFCAGAIGAIFALAVLAR